MAQRFYRSTLCSFGTWRLTVAKGKCFIRYLSNSISHYEEKLLKVYGNADGHVAVRRFIKVIMHDDDDEVNR